MSFFVTDSQDEGARRDAIANRVDIINNGTITFASLNAEFDKLREAGRDETPKTVFVPKWVADDPDMMRLLTEGPESRK